MFVSVGHRPIEISDNFEIVRIDDKIQEGLDPLGYLSVHAICKIKSGYSGPWYEKILNKPFEIQLRTLCMHCWAAVSHSALAGLFYVADSQFEQFNIARDASMEAAKTEISSEKTPIEINFDTVLALLKKIFPNRKTGDEKSISDFVQELKTAGYSSLPDVQNDIQRGYGTAEEYEKENEGGQFSLPLLAQRAKL